MSDTPVVVAYLNGQLLACHEAILAIWNVSQDQSQTELQRSATLDQFIYEAVQLLPPDMRPVKQDDFEDLLG